MSSELSISPFTDADRAAAHALLSSSRQIHIHLDWRRLSDRLAGPNLIGWLARSAGQDRRPLAFLGATLSHGGAAWLRFAAHADGEEPELLDTLWPTLRGSLCERGIAPLGMLAVSNWIEKVVQGWGFAHTNAVVTLRHRGKFAPPPPAPALGVRNATQQDLHAIAAIDAAAFESLWRHDASDLHFARAAAATFTVAELEGRIAGYQLSTQHGISGHIARLAVDPGVQKRGVGSNLVASALAYFHQRDIREVTVNTQHDNRASQRLYQRMGFKFARQSVPVWTIDPGT